MSKEIHIVIAIHITNRIEHAGEIQKILSGYGCYIKTRIGLHEASESFCSANGLIILEMIGNEEEADKMLTELGTVTGIETRKIVFDHESENML